MSESKNVELGIFHYKMEDLVPIVAELAEGYTSKESTSIPYSAAQQLMEAVIYCIKEYEDTQQSNNSLTESDQNIDLKLIYQKGYEAVIQKVKNAKDIYDELVIHFNGYRNRSYKDTFIKGIPKFFLYYDARFHPQNHILTLDYPTLIGTGELCGIDLIYQYLTFTKLEQEFLSAFPEQFIIELLNLYHGDYEELFDNLCGIVLRNSFGHMIVGDNLVGDGFDESSYEEIKAFVNQYHIDELEQRLEAMLHIIIKQGFQGNSILFEYLKEDIKDVVVTLINAVKYDNLKTIFIL